jgi:hypothetical protein
MARKGAIGQKMAPLASLANTHDYLPNNLDGADAIVPPILCKTPGPKRIVGGLRKRLALPFEVDVLVDNYLANAVAYRHARNLIIPVGSGYGRISIGIILWILS